MTDADLKTCRMRNKHQLMLIAMFLLGLPAIIGMVSVLMGELVLETVVPTVFSAFVLANYFVYELSIVAFICFYGFVVWFWMWKSSVHYRTYERIKLADRAKNIIMSGTTKGQHIITNRMKQKTQFILFLKYIFHVCKMTLHHVISLPELMTKLYEYRIIQAEKEKKLNNIWRNLNNTYNITAICVNTAINNEEKGEEKTEETDSTERANTPMSISVSVASTPHSIESEVREKQSEHSEIKTHHLHHSHSPHTSHAHHYHEHHSPHTHSPSHHSHSPQHHAGHHSPQHHGYHSPHHGHHSPHHKKNDKHDKKSKHSLELQELGVPKSTTRSTTPPPQNLRRQFGQGDTYTSQADIGSVLHNLTHSHSMRNNTMILGRLEPEILEMRVKIPQQLQEELQNPSEQRPDYLTNLLTETFLKHDKQRVISAEDQLILDSYKEEKYRKQMVRPLLYRDKYATSTDPHYALTRMLQKYIGNVHKLSVIHSQVMNLLNMMLW